MLMGKRKRMSEKSATDTCEKLATDIPEKLATDIPEKLATDIPEKVATDIPEAKQSELGDQLEPQELPRWESTPVSILPTFGF